MKTNTEIVTVIYTSDYKRITIKYMSNDEHEFAMIGDISDDELIALVEAEGRDVPGWTSELR